MTFVAHKIAVIFSCGNRNSFLETTRKARTMMTMRIMNWSLTCMIVALLQVGLTVSMEASPFPFDQVQPDGSVVTLRLHGDQFSNRLADLKGYTALRGDDGFFYYANLGFDGELVPTEYIVGREAPELLGLIKGIVSTALKNCELEICRDFSESNGTGRRVSATNIPPSSNSNSDHRTDDKNRLQNHRRTASATTGTLRNLVIPIRFKDHSDRQLPSVEELNVLFNNDGPDPLLCPTGSLKDVYKENSYGKLNIESTVVPWVTVKIDEKKASNKKSGLTTKTKKLIMQALDEADKVIDFSEFDDNGDGVVDAVTFLHSGYGAEWGETDEFGQEYENRMWSHKWTVDWESEEGVKVNQYHISPSLWKTSGNEIGHIGVIAHETGHFLGLPDRYDQDGDGEGIGNFGLMANSWGWDGTQLYPPHMSAYNKIQLGWLVPKEVEYGLNFVSATSVSEPNYDQVIKISYGFPEGEYLLCENRQAIGFDGIIPQGGLTIYHIDENADLYTQGFPRQRNWPQNGNHYQVAVLQADGAYDLEMEENRGDSGDVFYKGGVDSLLPSTDVQTGPFPNTDAYGKGDLYQTTNAITSISAPGVDMSFIYTNQDDVREPTSSPSQVPTLAPQVPSAFPSFRPSRSPSDLPTLGPSRSRTPSSSPSSRPSYTPSFWPSAMPSFVPSGSPTSSPEAQCLAEDEPCGSDDECCSGDCKIKKGEGTCKAMKNNKNKQKRG